MSTVEGKKQEKRRALLDAAYELFLERGTAKTSVARLFARIMKEYYKLQGME